tara:strand:- start:5611 stop:7383 length:1773 start_codon:yes stop_codon:yes gene_type:complete
MSLSGIVGGGATLSGVRGSQNLELPATVDGLSIGGDFGLPDQVVAKNKDTNILEWDFITNLSIPDNSITGDKLADNITINTTGDISCNKITSTNADLTNIQTANIDTISTADPKVKIVCKNFDLTDASNTIPEDTNIPDDTITGAMLKNDITISTTGDITSAKITATDADLTNIKATTIDTLSTADPKVKIVCKNFDLTDASNSVPDDTNIPDDTITGAMLKNDISITTTGDISCNKITATDADLTNIKATTIDTLSTADPKVKVDCKNLDLSDTTNLFGTHEFTEGNFGKVVVGGKDASGTGRSPGQLILKDRITDGNNCIMTSGNSSGARIQFSNPGTIDIANINNTSYDYAIRCRGQFHIDSDSGSNGILKFMDTNDKIEGFDGGSQTVATNLDLRSTTNLFPDDDGDKYQYIKIWDSASALSWGFNGNMSEFKNMLGYTDDVRHTNMDFTFQVGGGTAGTNDVLIEFFFFGVFNFSAFIIGLMSIEEGEEAGMIAQSTRVFSNVPAGDKHHIFKFVITGLDKDTDYVVAPYILGTATGLGEIMRFENGANAGSSLDPTVLSRGPWIMTSQTLNNVNYTRNTSDFTT